MRPARFASVFVAVAVVVGCSSPGSKPQTPAAVPSTTSAVLAPGQVGVAVSPSSPTAVTAQIGAPAGAVEMQLAFDPSFSGSAWQPVAATADLTVDDTGYQTLFVRFRDASGSVLGGVQTTAVVLDPELAAATASATGKHRVGTIGLVARDVLSLAIESGRIMAGRVERYDVNAPASGDQIQAGEEGRKVVVRDGAGWAEQQSAGSPWVRVFDRVAGRSLDPGPLDDARGYRIDSASDAGYGAGAAPTSVSRITRPTGLARTYTGNVLTTSNQLFLRLPQPLTEGATYTVSLPGGSVEPATFTFSDRSTRSLAVHVDQVGFAPSDPVKVAYLSAWTGAAGAIAYDPLPPFSVVDDSNGAVVASGTVKHRAVPSDGELHRGDLTGSPVYELDFSTLRTPGRYRACVDGIGCSYPFRIDATGTWMHVAVQVARAMYQQRSGVELAAAYTTATRPRVFHPDDGTVVHASPLTILEAGGPSQSDRYDKLIKAGSGDVVPGAWGGHFDAGDWDRHIDHLLYLRAAIDLVELYPEPFARLDLHIPESGDAIPDLIDEGLWDLDLYLRMQTPDGGVRGGIEYDSDPAERGASWTSGGQRAWAYAPDPRSSYVFAAAAAQAATVLGRYDVSRADRYAGAARRAFEWAEAHRSQAPADAGQSVGDQRLTALAALYRLTGEAAYQNAFVADAPWAQGPIDLLGCADSSVCEAAWLYARTDWPAVDATVKVNVVESFRRNADALVALSDITAYGWTLEHPYVPLVWGLGPSTPKTTGLMRAYALTHDERYRSTAVRDAAFSLGGNPMDTVMMTGIGHQNVRNPLIVDTSIGGMPVWPGTPVYGFHQLGGGDYWVTQYFLKPAGTTPDGTSVPYLWEWFDLPNVAMFNEFTVHQSHPAALFGLGSLAAVGAGS